MPEEPSTQKHIDHAVMEAIRNRKMRPRSYFVVQAILMFIAAALLFLLLLYFVSLIIFALHENGIWFAPDFGLSGWSLFLEALPWGLLLVSFALVVLLANLLKRYAFIYHQPLFYFLFAFIILIILGGFFIAATSFHPEFFRYSEDNLPIVGSFYQFETAAPASVHRGQIVAFTANDEGFVIDDGLGITSTVIAAQGVVFLQEFHVGDIVLVFGTRGNDGVINAFGIQLEQEATSTGATSSSGTAY